ASSDIIIKSNIDFSGVKQAPTTIQNVPAFATRSLAEKHFIAEDVEKDSRSKELTDRIEQSVPPEHAGILKDVKRRGIDQDAWKAASSEITSKMDLEFILNNRDEIMLRTLLAYVKGKNAREQGRAIGDPKDIERLEFKLMKIETVRRQKQLARIQGFFSDDVQAVLEDVTKVWGLEDFALLKIGAFLEDKLPEIASANLDTYRGFTQALELKTKNYKGLVRVIADVVVKKASNGEILNQLEETVFDWVKGGILKAGADQPGQVIVNGKYMPKHDKNKWKKGQLSEFYPETNKFYDEMMEFCVQHGILEPARSNVGNQAREPGDLLKDEMGSRLQELAKVDILRQLKEMRQKKKFQLADTHFYAWYAGIVNHEKFSEIPLEKQVAFKESFVQLWKDNGQYFENELANEGKILLYRIANLFGTNSPGTLAKAVGIGNPRFYVQFYGPSFRPNLGLMEKYMASFVQKAAETRDKPELKSKVEKLCAQYYELAKGYNNVDAMLRELKNYDDTNPRFQLIRTLLESAPIFGKASSLKDLSQLFFPDSSSRTLTKFLQAKPSTQVLWTVIQGIKAAVGAWTVGSFRDVAEGLVGAELVEGAFRLGISQKNYVELVKAHIIHKITRWTMKNPYGTGAKRYWGLKFYSRAETGSKYDLTLEEDLAGAAYIAYLIFTGDRKLRHDTVDHLLYKKELNFYVRTGTAMSANQLRNLLHDLRYFYATDRNEENGLIYLRAMEQLQRYCDVRGVDLNKIESSYSHFFTGKGVPYRVKLERLDAIKWKDIEDYFQYEITKDGNFPQEYFDLRDDVDDIHRASDFSDKTKWLERLGFTKNYAKKKTAEFLTKHAVKVAPDGTIQNPLYQAGVEVAKRRLPPGTDPNSNEYKRFSPSKDDGKCGHAYWVLETLELAVEAFATEAPLYYVLANPDTGEKILFSGHVDLLAIVGGKLHVLDYKPDLRFDASPGTTIKVFLASLAQVGAYGAMACLQFGLKPSEVVCSTINEDGCWQYNPLDALQFATEMWQEAFAKVHGETNPDYQNDPDFWPEWYPLQQALEAIP
ncbi:MAG: hypothetical protein ACFE8P_06460, partial [Promethearchaeota archaeon]